MRGIILLLLTLLATPAAAHERSVSYVEARADGERVAVSLRLRRLDLALLAAERPALGPVAHGAPLGPEAAAILGGFVALSADGAPCAHDAPEGRPDGAPWLALRFVMRCPGPPDALALRGVWAIPGHLGVATVSAGGEPQRFVLTALAPAARWSGAPTAALLAGALHIVSGYDHVAFVLLLVLGVGGLREAAVTVTGFTLGHSLTLSLMALGFVEVDGRAVELVIAFSVLALAAELARQPGDDGLFGVAPAALAGVTGLAAGVPALLGAGLISASGSELLRHGASPARVRQALAALFGLAHGLGFAGALTAGGRPSPGLLVTWNLGVELGQLAIVGAALPLLAALRGRLDTVRKVGVGGGALVGAIALGRALFG